MVSAIVRLSSGGDCGELSAVGDTDLGEDVREMGLHRGATDEQPLGDLGVRETLGDERDDLELGWGEARPP